MSETAKEAGGTGPSHQSVEIGVAIAMAIVALIGIYGSVEVGIGWGAEGPRAGFFPFYVSVIILISCAVNLASAFISSEKTTRFAEWGQIRQVVSVLVPTAVYVALIPSVGIYVSSGLLIAFFMSWFGRYNWTAVVLVAVIVPVLTFVTFEIWFLVPLPKGPLEVWLGY